MNLMGYCITIPPTYIEGHPRRSISCVSADWLRLRPADAKTPHRDIPGGISSAVRTFPARAGNSVTNTAKARTTVKILRKLMGAVVVQRPVFATTTTGIGAKGERSSDGPTGMRKALGYAVGSEAQGSPCRQYVSRPSCTTKTYSETGA